MAIQRLRHNHSWPRPDVLFAALTALVCAGLLFLLPRSVAGDTYSSDTQKNRSAQSVSLKGLPSTDLTEDEAIVHALNRLGYGPRPRNKPRRPNRARTAIKRCRIRLPGRGTVVQHKVETTARRSLLRHNTWRRMSWRRSFYLARRISTSRTAAMPLVIPGIQSRITSRCKRRSA